MDDNRAARDREVEALRAEVRALRERLAAVEVDGGADHDRLEELRALLVAAVVQSSAGIIVADAPSGRIRMANPAAFDLPERGGALLAEEEAARRYSSLRLFDPDGRTPIPEAERPMQRAIRGEPSENVEVIIRRDGAPDRWVVANAAPVRTAAGKAVGAVAVFHDVTEARIRERRLRESEERYRRVSDFTGQLVYDWDVASGAIRWAGKTMEIAGLSLAQFDALGIAGWEERIHPDDRAGSVEELDRAMDAREPYRCSYRFRREDGTYAEIEDHGGFLYDEAGKAVRMLGAMQDVTERKRAAELMRASEEWFRTLLENINEVVFSIDAEGRIVYVSPPVEAFTGFDPAEVVGEPFSLFVHPDNLPALRADFGRTMEGRSAPAEFRVLAKDGTVRLVSTSSRPVLEGSRPIGLTGIMTDITERKAAEEAIQNLNAELERRVVARTVELEAANKELEAFSYAVSHDLRAPLRAIDGFGQALVEDYGTRLDAVGHDYLSRIRSNTQKMAALIDGLLRLSRLTRAPLKRVPVDLSRLAEAACEDLASAEPGRRVEATVRPGLVVSGDPALLAVVVDNLLRNAWKFTSRREDAVVEFGEAEAALGSTARERVFFVRDNGAGFDPQYTAKLFGAFQRLHGANEFPGSGIGLATVQRIVRRHGGRVFAEGAEGAGATFFFALPEESGP